MKRSSPYYPLRYLVECKPSGQAFFETIAAFNVAEAAIDYARQCARANAGTHQYQATAISHRGGKTLLVAC